MDVEWCPGYNNGYSDWECHGYIDKVAYGADILVCPMLGNNGIAHVDFSSGLVILPPNRCPLLRKQLKMNNWYITETINEEKVLKTALEGDMIHYHKDREPCNERCSKKVREDSSSEGEGEGEGEIGALGGKESTSGES